MARVSLIYILAVFLPSLSGAYMEQFEGDMKTCMQAARRATAICNLNGMHSYHNPKPGTGELVRKAIKYDDSEITNFFTEYHQRKAENLRAGAKSQHNAGNFMDQSRAVYMTSARANELNRWHKDVCTGHVSKCVKYCGIWDMKEGQTVQEGEATEEAIALDNDPDEKAYAEARWAALKEREKDPNIPNPIAGTSVEESIGRRGAVCKQTVARHMVFAQIEHEQTASIANAAAGIQDDITSNAAGEDEGGFLSKHGWKVAAGAAVVGGVAVGGKLLLDKGDKKGKDKGGDDSTDDPDYSDGGLDTVKDSTPPETIERVNDLLEEGKIAEAEAILNNNNAISDNYRSLIRDAIDVAKSGETPEKLPIPGQEQPAVAAATTTREMASVLGAAPASKILQDIAFFKSQGMDEEVEKLITQLISEGKLHEAFQQISLLRKEAGLKNSQSKMADRLQVKLDAKLVSMGLPSGQLGLDMLK